MADDMLTLLEYLRKPYPNGHALFEEAGERPHWLSDSPSSLEVYAALIAINNGRTVIGGWGIVSFGGLYGRIGLAGPMEAYALAEMSAFIAGWLEAIGAMRREREQRELVTSITQEHERVRALGGPHG